MKNDNYYLDRLVSILLKNKFITPINMARISTLRLRYEYSDSPLEKQDILDSLQQLVLKLPMRNPTAIRIYKVLNILRGLVDTSVLEGLAI